MMVGGQISLLSADWNNASTQTVYRYPRRRQHLRTAFSCAWSAAVWKSLWLRRGRRVTHEVFHVLTGPSGIVSLKRTLGTPSWRKDRENTTKNGNIINN